MTALTTLRKANQRLRALSHRILEVRDFERYAIAHDLHDEIGRTLPLITLTLCELEKQQGHPDAALHEKQVADSFQILDQVRHHLRSLASNVKAHKARRMTHALR